MSDTIVQTTPATGAVLNAALQTFSSDLSEKTIHVVYSAGLKPQVEFTGDWSGKFLKAALASISKAYRLRRHKMHKPSSQGEAGLNINSTREGVTGDGTTK